MCRFLLVKFKNPDRPNRYLEIFSSICQKSRAYDGKRQGDGWGISFLINNQWKTEKSLLPIWRQKEIFSSFPKTKIFSVHARSASFPFQKGIIEYNQPFVEEPYIFVFNGFLKGISLSNLPGKIGAEKIWFLLKKMLKKMDPKDALIRTRDIILKNCRQVQALNIGLSDKKNIYGLNFFSKYARYYQMYYFKNNSKKIICSEKFEKKGGWEKAEYNKIFKF